MRELSKSRRVLGRALSAQNYATQRKTTTDNLCYLPMILKSKSWCAVINVPEDESGKIWDKRICQ